MASRFRTGCYHSNTFPLLIEAPGGSQSGLCQPGTMADQAEANSTALPVQDTHSRRRVRRRLAQIGTGHAVYASFNWLFDNVLYVYVILRLGLAAGGAIMTTFSLVQCAATLLLYERMKIDWVGAGSIAHLVSIPNPSWWQRIIAWAAKRGAAFVFLALCVFQDPFITTAYFRQGRFDGLRARDWRIFLASVVVSNFYWTLRSGAVAGLLVGVWRWLSQA